MRNGQSDLPEQGEAVCPGGAELPLLCARQGSHQQELGRHLLKEVISSLNLAMLGITN